MADLITVPTLEELADTEYSDDELPRVKFLISYASAYVRRRVPTVDVDLTGGDLSQDLVNGIVGFAVIRALADQDIGIRVTKIQYPEVATEYSAATEGIDALLCISDGDIQLLHSQLDASTTAFSIKPG